MKAVSRFVFVCLWFSLFATFASVSAFAQYDQCVWALNPSASNAFSMSGSVSVSAPNCGVVVDSTSSSAMRLSGSVDLSAKYIDIAGGYSKSGAVTVSPAPATGSAMPPAPLSFLVPPTSSSCTYTNVKISGSKSQTLSPGTYCGGITISGSSSITFNPGTYILMGGGLNVSGSVNLTGTGVTFFLTQGLGYSYGPLTVSGSVKMALKAPTCGLFEGILFYQDSGIGTGKAGSSFSGSSSSAPEGVLYFPTTSLTYTGSTAGDYLAVVANTITLTGSATLPTNFSGLCNAGPLAPPVAVSVTPASAALTGGLTQQFTATVTNANPSKTGVTWSISPSGAGSIDASGLYTAPATISTQQTVTVTATSHADPTKSSSATVTLLPPVAPTIIWAAPAAITYGTLISGAQLDAVANAPGTLTYSPSLGAVIPAGSQTLAVTFTPANTTLFTPATVTVLLTVNKATPAITWPAPAPITYGMALGATQLDATSNVPGTFAYSPAIGGILAAGNQILTATFTPSDTADYNSTTASAALTVKQATLAITWAAPAPITYGTALGSTQLDATVSVPGTFTYSPSAGTVPAAGNQTLSVTFTPTDSKDYATATASVPLTVSPATPVITWAAPAAITYGTALSATQLDATANLPGTFSYSPASGAVLPAGAQTLGVTFTPSDATDYTTATATVTLTVNQPVSCDPNGYSYARAITIDHNQVPNTDQANFPFLFNTTDPLLAGTAYGGHVSNPNGYDIVFASDPAGKNLLPYEMEEYNSQTGQVIAWVQIPTVSHTQDTVIYLFYGNPNITASQQNPTAVWDANYVGVWHVPNGTQLSLADSTSNQNSATNNGAAATAGQIDGGMSTDGTSYATIGTQPDLANLAQGNATFSAWVNASDDTYGVLIGKDYPSWMLGIWFGNPEFFLPSANLWFEPDYYLTPGQWSYITVTLSGTGDPNGAATPLAMMYVNGQNVGTMSGNPGPIPDDSSVLTYMGYAPGEYGSQTPVASEDEFRISNIIRSPDWIATEYANQNSPSTFYNLSPEGISINPVSSTLYGNQTQQFTANILESCSNSVSWTISPSGVGTISAGGVYTAPATITAPQTVTVTATNPTNPVQSASATINLLPPVAVTVSPANLTISDGNQTQQFTSSVAYTSNNNTAVTWSISPATGAGTLDQTGFYTAPASITATQTVTITATSQFDPTKSGSATVTLTPAALPPPICTSASNGYSFMRAIVIDHNQVPNTDQANFPFLFNSTDPAFATTVNGGHMVSFNAADLMFSSDPAGQNPLNYELEEYDPAGGQIIAWIRIPNVSHTSNTVLYMFYGNSAIASTQQNPSAVWNSNFMGVWHVPNGNQLSLADSTANANDGTDNNAYGTAGQIDGGMASWGYGYATIGNPANLANLAHGNATFSAWVDSIGDGGMILGKGGLGEGGGWTLGVNNNNLLELEVYDSDSSTGIPVSTTQLNPGWNLVAATVTQGTTNPAQSQVNLYVNGAVAGTGTLQFDSPVDDSTYPAYLAYNDTGDFDDQIFYPFIGAEDEFRISNNARSADWIATEYNNQNTPSKFYGLYPENFSGAVPSTVSLYASQTEQFSTVAPCSALPANWSMPEGSPGTLTAGGFYTAPSSITSQQTIAITATSPTDGSTVGTSTLTLLPPIAVTVSPQIGTVYTGATQQFTATVLNTSNTNVTWSLSPAGAGTISSSGYYQAPGYIQGPETVTVTATSRADPTKSASATFTITADVVVTVVPAAVSLTAGQSQTFSTDVETYDAGCGGGCASGWSINPPNEGTISSSGDGTYTAPAAIPTLQTVTVTATASLEGVTSTGNATVTLIPPVVSVSPQATTLYGGESKQFLATIINSPNRGITWSISPSGIGTFTSSGLYSAPPVITSPQTITITATSQAVPSISASATVTLSPTQCPAKAYSYVRPIVIDHTKVPSSDQADFPFYFAATDPTLASTSNGGHVTSPTGNDIVFSSDPAGLQPLPFDLEQYNPATGQIVAWVQAPALSHSQDTVIYMFYGNSSITGPQQGSAGVWDTNYTGVYQFDNLQNGSLIDSTDNGNNGTVNNVQTVPGQPGAAGTFDGSTSFVSLPANDFASFPYSGQSGAIFNASVGVWFKTVSAGVILGQTDGSTPLSGYAYGYIPALYVDTNGYLRGNLFNLQNVQQIVSPAVVNDNNWHYAVLTFDTTETTNTIGFYGGVSSVVSGVETLYIDGRVAGVQSGGVASGYSSSYAYLLGTGFTGYSAWPDTAGNNGWFYFNGSLDQVEVSSIARSNGWVQSEYNNQSSPATFFTLGAETGSTPSLNPVSVTLYQSQGQQFTVLETGMCNAGTAAWSMPAGSPGTLSPTGFYTAPASINTQQIVTVTGTTLGANSTPLRAAITLMPPVSITLAPGVASLPAGGTQQFTATVANATNTAVNWTISPAGVGSISASGLYTAPATISGPQTISIIATSQADPTQSASASVTLGATPAVPSIALNPQTVILYAGQVQQFTATVTNTSNPAVTWSVSPTGAGAIDASGFYTAPATIPAAQTVTITATSQADSAVTATATISLAPAQCASNGYGYVRAVTIDHTKIPNTDQANFPFLFSTADPLLATTANGGHVASASGYDIVFTSDPAGQNPLNFEMEEYNPATGQVIAWVQIPDLSHTSDTVIYLFYGNPNVTAPQQNPTAAWDLTFQAVWHLPNGTALSANDSTANGNNGTITDATPVAGQIDGGASFNGSSSQIICGSNVPGFQFSAAQSFTDSAWFNLSTGSNGWMSVLSNSRDVSPWHGLWIDGTTDVFGEGYNLYGATISTNAWHYMVAVQNGGTGRSLYIDGALVASDQSPQDANGGGTCYIGNDSVGEAFQGSIDEVRIASVARSSDWIAAEYANQSSPSTFFALSAENETSIAPAAVTLYSGQSQQFTAPSMCSAGVTWSLSSDAPGVLTTGGLYTAPATITSQQTLTVTATSQSSSGTSASATVTLMPPVAVTVAPSSVTLNANQTQQFAATVVNAVNPGVAWSISPAGMGAIDQNGGYIAPASITAQQTVTITATSLTDPTKYASAMVTLAPSICASTGYGYQRVIVIDHTKVANTDQVNFPFLFNSTDPDLATVDNGGHVANPNGYDIIFSTDPNGQTRLDFEIEQYNPATGQLAAWIRIPTLSHSSDTVLYVFYGNPAITTSQANPVGVWDSSYQAVYHLGNLPATGIASDSTNYANSAAFTNLTEMPGEIDGSAALDGVTSFLEIPASAFPSYPTGVYSNIGVNTAWQNTSFDATYGIWFKTSGWGGLLDQTAGDSCVGFFGICLFPSPEQPGTDPNGSWGSLLDVNFDGYLEGRSVGPTTQTYNDNNWHHATITFENGINKLYADGQLVATGSGGTFGFSPNYAYFVGTEDAESDTSSLDSQPWKYLPGQVDEIDVSNTARSGDWIQTQFNNQSSPSTFYKFYAPSAIQVAPSLISLYASQSEQFTVPGTCDASISWSLPAGGAGTLDATGLYTAPSVVSSQQTVTVSAMSQSTGASFGSAQITLLPPPPPLTLVASAPSPYQVGSTQSFTATLLDPQGNPRIGMTVNFTVAGPNETVGSATTSATGTASFTYTGANNGTDTVQATASVDGSLLTSNPLTAAWITPPPAQAPALTLLPQPSPGRGALMGAFTDKNGDLIEPIVVGSTARTFITPAGATRLQLGVDDDYYEDNGGAGFVVSVNGAKVTVPPTAMPWSWTRGGLNNNYQYGINDGSSPVIAVATLTSGQPVSVAYQSGTISTNYPMSPMVNAAGDANFVTGTQLYQGAYFPTLYTTGSAYPQNQPINLFAVVVDASGVPIPNTPVTLTISGANPGQYQATTDATGTASFLYTGQYAGNDSLQAQATIAGGLTLDSDLTTIDWTNYPTPPAVGTLSLNQIVNIVNSENFSSFARDSSGNALPNVNVGFYVTGVDHLQSSSTTNNIGQASFGYYHTQSGNYSVIAVDSVGRNVIVTPAYTGYWNVPSGTPVTSTGAVSVGITASSFDTLPNPLQLNGSVSDSASPTTTDTWSEISGPGTVTFADPSNPVTTATFSKIGTYVLELFATDNLNSGWAQITVTVVAPSVASQAQGWIGSPLYGSAVSGVVPITLAPGVTLTSGTLSYAPANDPSSVTTLNSSVSGSGKIGVLDTTALANGSYLIQMQGTNSSGTSEYSLVLVTVTGGYKPGRVTSTVTDLVVPATGLPIQIQRNYDSLNASQSLDFGYGWSLGINVNLVVDTSGNVTFTLGGQRKTFYLTPQEPPCTIVGCLFPYYFVAFTPEPGLHGSLTDSEQGCPLDIVVPYGSLWECYGGSGQYDPPGYIYTDPNGTAYTISASGALQSITDKNGNGLTITPNGITSTTGLNVPFVRDSQGRITQITDPSGNVYLYQYDTNGNLASVSYPNTPQPSTYTYAPNHYYLSGTDFRNNPLPSIDYYGSGDTDAEGDSLAGKMKSVTDALGETTAWAYDLTTNTTTITYPPDATGKVGTATMVYDSHGDLLQSTDPLGHTTTDIYDKNLNLTSSTDPLGHTTNYTYDANGNKTSTTYPATATSTNTTSTANYNQFSAPTSVADELGNAQTINYDANYSPTSITDSLGTIISTIFNSNGTLQAGAAGYDITQAPSKATQFAYDANGDLVSKTDPLGRTTGYTYDSLGHMVSMSEPSPDSGVNTGSPAALVRSAALSHRAKSEDQPNGGSSQGTVTATFVFDSLGNMTETTTYDDDSFLYVYDGNSNLTSYTDALGNTTTFTYDALNRLTLITFPDKTTISFTYDFRNNVVTMTDQSSHVTSYQYDLSGNATSITQAYGTSSATTTAYAYDAANRVTTVTDALSHVTSYTYDSAGNVTGISGVAGTFTFGYDNARNVTSATDGNGNTTQYQYDARKRVTQVTYPDQTTMTATYDGHGDVTSVTDQAGNQIQYTYDAANELTGVIEVNSPNTGANTESYSYDGDGNLLSWTDPNGHSTAATYDNIGNPVSFTLPDGNSSETRQFDANGNLISYTHLDGATTTYTYDKLNRLLTRSTPGEAAVSFIYTPTGKYATSIDASGTTTYTYDSMDRLITKATPQGTLNYTYDAAGHVASIASSNANGASMSYTYDDLNRLATATDNRTGGVTTYTYDNSSNVATVTYPNGVEGQFQYDTLNRVSSLATQQTGYTYRRGPTGNLTGATEQNGRTENWTYDGIYRLSNETITGDPSQNNGSVSYGLDPVGNRLTESASLPNLPSGTWNYSSDDLLSNEAYDQNGNTITEGGKAFAYDPENHLVSMSGTGASASMVYDAFGNRVTKIVNGVTTTYLVEDDVNPTGLPQVFDELTNGAVTRTYAYGLQRIDEDQIVNGAWTPSYYGYDGGGSVRNLTNSAGTITDSYEYDAYGNSFTASGSTPNNYLYRGEQWDPDLSLYYLRFRYYNPLTGRFLSKDSLPGHTTLPKTLHRYEYAEADPVNGMDPMGREDLVEESELDEDVSVRSEGELEEIGRRVNCILGTAAAALDVLNDPDLGTLINFSYNLEECSATGEGTGEGGRGPNSGGGSGEGIGCPLCFAAGTPVLTDRGEVPIEKIEVGDKVVARNSETGKLEQEPVTALVPKHQGKLLEIRVEGERDPLRPSLGHPFWARHGDSATGDWIEAERLRIGDLLETQDGNWRRITAIMPVANEETVYNFTVDEDHDYFVGGTGFLVHNAGCGPCHGNSRSSLRPATLYKLVDGFGNFLKWGISQNPASRYSQTFLNSLGGQGGRAIPVTTGPRSEMLDLERDYVSRNPGPLNNEPWAGCLWTPIE